MVQPHGAVNIPRGVSHTGGPANAIVDEEQPRFTDSSAPLFNMYRKIAEEEDNKMAERWQKDADGILIFTGLFSAAVAALAAVTVMDLKPNSQDTSAFYLENIYRLLADPNISRSSIPVTPLRPPPFSPPKYVIWVNSLWFLSLAISLTCAMLATLIHQWARRYLRMTHRPRDNPHDAARIRAFFAHGIEKFRFSWVVEAIPTLIHISLFLFFAGLLVYLFNINDTVFRAVVWWVAVSGVAYLLTTITPILRRDAPYYSPLSLLAPLARPVISYPYFLLLCVRHRWNVLRWTAIFFSATFQGMEKMVETSARESSPEIDGHILKWTFDALTQDHDLDQFFKCILGFYHSKVVKDSQLSLARLRSRYFSSALGAYLDRTWTPNDNLVSESDKIRQIVTCVKIADVLDVDDGWVVCSILQSRHGHLSVELGHSLRIRDNRSEQEIGLLAQTIIAVIIADVQGSNDRWIALAADQLGKSENNIRGYLAHGNNNLLLANLIHITRQILSPSSVVSQDMARKVALCFPESLYSFEIGATLLSLQHDFCALWNEIVPEARNSGYFSTPACILRAIRRLYIALHQGADDAQSSYPLCNNPGHRPGETGHTPDPILATPLPPISPAHTSPHFSDTSLPGDVTNALQLAIAPIFQESHAVLATSQHIAGGSAAPLHNEPITTTTTPPSPSMDPGSLSLAPFMSVHSSALTGDLHSLAGFSVSQSDRPPHGPASSSSSPTTDPSPIPPHATSFSNPSDTTSIAIPGMHDNIQDTNVPTFGGEDRDPSENLA